MLFRWLVSAIALCLLSATASAQAPFPAEDLMRGDANGDLRVDGSDPIFINEWLFNGGSTPPCLNAADADDNGKIDINDSAYLNAYLFMGGPMPPPPFPSCGLDYTTPNLSCQSPSCP